MTKTDSPRELTSATTSVSVSFSSVVSAVVSSFSSVVSAVVSSFSSSVVSAVVSSFSSSVGTTVVSINSSSVSISSPSASAKLEIIALGKISILIKVSSPFNFMDLTPRVALPNGRNCLLLALK